MGILLYIDNEVPWSAGGFGEWSGRSQAGQSSIIRSQQAAWPWRGSYGLRLQTVADMSAWVWRGGIARPVAPGSSVFVGMQLRLGGLPSSGTGLLSPYNPAGGNC